MFEGQILNPLYAGYEIVITEVLVGGKLTPVTTLSGKNNCTAEQKVGVWSSVYVWVCVCVFVLIGYLHPHEYDLHGHPKAPTHSTDSLTRVR